MSPQIIFNEVTAVRIMEPNFLYTPWHLETPKRFRAPERQRENRDTKVVEEGVNASCCFPISLNNKVGASMTRHGDGTGERAGILNTMSVPGTTIVGLS